MIKPVRLIVYSSVLGAAVWAAELMTEPSSAPAGHKPHAASGSEKLAPGITEADLHAHFARYEAGQGDAFEPKVIPRKLSGSVGSPNSVEAAGGSWALTGVTAVNGERSAVMENESTHEIVFMKQGESWNGMRVASVDADSVLLINALNQKTRISFADPQQPDSQTRSASTLPTGVTTVGALAPASIVLPGRLLAPASPNTRDESVNMR